MDEASILRSIPPFDQLPRERFDEAARAAVERRFPAGARLAQAGGEPMQHLFVIREGSVRLERHGQTVQVLEEGRRSRRLISPAAVAATDCVVERPSPWDFCGASSSPEEACTDEDEAGF